MTLGESYAEQREEQPNSLTANPSNQPHARLDTYIRPRLVGNELQPAEIRPEKAPRNYIPPFVFGYSAVDAVIIRAWNWRTDSLSDINAPVFENEGFGGTEGTWITATTDPYHVQPLLLKVKQFDKRVVLQ